MWAKDVLPPDDCVYFTARGRLPTKYWAGPIWRRKTEFGLSDEVAEELIEKKRYLSMENRLQNRP